MNKLNFDEFIRSVSISKNDTYALLLGAGCSISSGIPSAIDCVWDWKKEIYITNNNAFEQKWLNNIKSPKVQKIVQKWIDNQGNYIEKDNPEEYSFYAKKCFPIERNRSQYFQKICTGKKPSIGYRLIPLLTKAMFLDTVWTTNFDNLISDACVYGRTTGLEISLDTVNRINSRTQNKLELPIVKLHGDFKYGELKNTNEELKQQDNTFRNKLIEYLTDKHLIVIGYSGRDYSLMKTLEEAYSKKGAGFLFWCGYGENISQNVTNLLDSISNNNRESYYVQTNGFDNTMLSITKSIVSNDKELTQELDLLQREQQKPIQFKKFDLNPERVNKVLKSNLFPVSFPDEVLVFNYKSIEKPWEFVKNVSLTEPDMVAVPYKGQIWAFGTAKKIKESFKDVIIGDISRKPLTDTRIYHSAINQLMLSSICKLLSTSNKLNTNFRDKLWSNEYKSIAGEKVYSAIRLSLERISDEYYLSMNPSFEINNPDVSNTTLQQIGITFYHKIWNNIFNEYINKWRNLLFNQNDYEFPLNSGTGFYFMIRKSPIFTSVCDLNNYSTNAHNTPQNLLRFKSIQFKEAKLLFSNNYGHETSTDTHPMRGLIKYKPYETDLESFLSNAIDLAVISPKNEENKLYDFLLLQNQFIKKYNEKDDYIIDFVGFYKIYNISLNIPEPNSSNWQTLDEPQEKTIRQISNEIKRNICDKITKLCSFGSQKIVVIYIPERWEQFTYYNREGESFDLHNYIKAFCVEKRVTTQFIREKTIKDVTQRCQINWWLSLSYYVKSFRTPWLLDNTDEETAFAGIGYSVESKEDNDSHIILGCSHIYSSTGEGLKYKLTKINNDRIKWRNKKPHLSYDDAYEFGRNVINLFYESMNVIPKRVVVHKRTYFEKDEKQGILDSLYDNEKIENVDLIEINYEDNIKYVSSKIYDGRATVDGFSVGRGTCILIEENSALLWAHGVVPSVRNPNYNYFPGGRYIPKPLKIIKHYGIGSLEQIANEILGLTKMNWNTFNMYSQLPATILSSNEIAKIGKLIENQDKIEYDYRYFI